MAITLTSEQSDYVRQEIAAAGANATPPFAADYVLAWQTKLGVVLQNYDGEMQITALVRARNGWEDEDATFKAAVADLVAASLEAWRSVN
jgi:hypothetical protein